MLLPGLALLAQVDAETDVVHSHIALFAEKQIADEVRTHGIQFGLAASRIPRTSNRISAPP